ncbi:methyltransferase domain-containing protein [Halorussus gelatinilyticus]|uniref:tRNA (guanine(10)-N(2))-dimethyltransferase n=1 Tax=Halorussus gelatinilyticus TaxID=2937524 RepID=A0A8U0ILI6_9EURY|nr:methyltransferase domain-containing protein [Halorussus gelatinilyticus]UPW01471.1 methyltransferase domain-containing protein [Halorussus gelatinilyticus]
MYALELGGEDDQFAAAEAASAATGVEVVAPGLATATAITDRVRTLAYTHRASEVVGRTDATLASARALLDAAGIDREGTVAVRARDVRETADIDTQRVERELGSVLTDRGFAVDLDDPDHELRALFSEARSASEGSSDEPRDDTCLLGWLAAESVRDFGTRKPTDRPFFQPGGMDPLLARALVNLAGARPGATVLDPMCGTGGVLIEAGLVGAEVLGADAQRKMARGAAENLAHYLGGERADSGTIDGRAAGDWATLLGDATHLPFPDGSVDAVVFDAPYGRQSKIANLELDDLVAGALAEARRVADRAVVVGDRSWADAARDAGWAVEDEFERRVHRSLVRHVVVLSDDATPGDPDSFDAERGASE